MSFFPVLLLVSILTITKRGKKMSKKIKKLKLDDGVNILGFDNYTDFENALKEWAKNNPAPYKKKRGKKNG